MSDYRINFDKMINTKDTSNLSQMLGVIDNNDKLTVIIDNNSSKNAEIILRVLYENGFDCTTSGGADNNSYYITATRVNRDSFVGIH